jgi:hypothetical protein
MPEVVEANLGKSVLCQDLLQCVQGGRPLGSGSSIDIGEYQAVILVPGSLLFLLMGLVTFQGFRGDLGQPHRSRTLGGLGGLKTTPPFVLERVLTTYRRPSIFGINVLPA